MNPSKAKSKRTHHDSTDSARKEEEHNNDDVTGGGELPAPPDGGYGWVIVFASFMCNMFVDGVGYCFGIFLPALIDDFHSSKSQTAWVGSILTGMVMSAGPVVGLLTNKFGCRWTCIGGSLLTSASFVLSTFCPTIETLMFVYGFLGGFGFGLMYLPAIVCVGYYFESKRSLATGIAVCGSGVGTFAFAPLANYLKEEYGWRGANYFIATGVLCCIVFGALMKPLEYDDEKNDNTGNNNKGSEKKNTTGSAVEMTQSKLSISSKRSHVVQPLSRKDVFYTGSVSNLKEFQSQKSLDKYRHSIQNIAQRRHDDKKKGCIGSVTSGLKSFLGQLVDVSLLSDPVFMFIGISNVFSMAALYVPFVYIVESAIDDGIDKDKASMLISVIGITNTIGRVICGYVADFPQINSLLVNNICLVLGAVSVAATPFCHTYTAYMIICIFFAIAIAGYISLTSIILVDLLGLDKLTNSFGLLILFRGAACFVGSPLAGALLDGTGSYAVPFYGAGGFFLVAALLSFAVPYVDRKKKRKIQQTPKSKEDVEASVPLGATSTEIVH